MHLVVYLFLGLSIFLGAIHFFGEPISQVMSRKKGAIIFSGVHHIKEVLLLLLIHIWGGHMVLLV